MKMCFGFTVMITIPLCIKNRQLRFLFMDNYLICLLTYFWRVPVAPAYLGHASHVGAHTSSRSSYTVFDNDGPDAPGYRHHSRCHVVVSVSFDAYDGVVLHGFSSWFPHIERGRQPRGYEDSHFEIRGLHQLYPVHYMRTGSLQQGIARGAFRHTLLR